MAANSNSSRKSSKSNNLQQHLRTKLSSHHQTLKRGVVQQAAAKASLHTYYNLKNEDEEMSSLHKLRNTMRRSKIFHHLKSKQYKIQNIAAKKHRNFRHRFDQSDFEKCLLENEMIFDGNDVKEEGQKCSKKDAKGLVPSSSGIYGTSQLPHVRTRVPLYEHGDLNRNSKYSKFRLVKNRKHSRSPLAKARSHKVQKLNILKEVIQYINQLTKLITNSSKDETEVAFIEEGINGLQVNS